LSKLPVDGSELYYEESGRGQSILFIHGSIADANIWDEQIALLSPSFRCVAYDRRGYTRSPLGSVALPSPELHAEDAAGLIRKLRLGRCLLVATCAGAVVGLDLMMRYPELLRGAVLSEPAAFSLDGVGGEDFLTAVTSMVSEAHAQRGANEAVDAFADHLDPKAWSRTGETERDRMRANHQALFRLLQAPGYPLTADQLAGISVPCVVIYGESTPEIFKRIALRLADRLEGSRLIQLDGAGHHTYLHRPDAFAKIVKAFATQLDSETKESSVELRSSRRRSTLIPGSLASELR
jgi:pimeloyl-ACP methyl ester carboxylesterase